MNHTCLKRRDITCLMGGLLFNTSSLSLNNNDDVLDNWIKEYHRNPSTINHKRNPPKLIKTIAIDAGHGGQDPGAIGLAGTQEKNIVLSMALKLSEILRLKYGYTVILTRTGDYFVPLTERVKKARQGKAHLFISLHADAFYSPTARGASVFALSEKSATSTAASWIATQQNNADLMGGLRLNDLGIQDPMLAHVLVDLSATTQIKTSLNIGQQLLNHLGQMATLHKKTVEQAGFAVLKSPDMPSLLIETGFITHPDEEQLLADEVYQYTLMKHLAKAIALSTNRYIKI